MSNTQDKEIRIGLVEDQLLFRQGLKAILESWPNFNVMFESPDGYSVMDRLKKEEELPNVMLLDLSLPPRGHEEYNGDRVLSELKRQYPEMKVIILSVHEDEYFIAKLIEMGANGYLVKDSDPQEVHDAVESAYINGSYINQRSLQAIQKRLNGKVKQVHSHDKLTEREVEVLKLVCQQMTADEIGDKLFISPKTVNGHKNNLLQKTGSKNMTGLVMYAVKHHIVEVI